MKKALITGISGQDGAYLARLLLEKGYRVFGTSRDAAASPFSNLERLGLRERVELLTMPPHDPARVTALLEQLRPDEIYNLAGQSSVGLSFARPRETIADIVQSDLNLLEAVRVLALPTRIFNASSGECFGDTGGTPADETTPFNPNSPYASAKAASCWQTRVYRRAYGIFACSGLLYNHESPLRPEGFVTRKIIDGALNIAARRETRLTLGNIDIERDWGWAPEYVEAMWLMLQQEKPTDFVIATGHSYPLREFVATAFSLLGLDWREHTSSDPTLLRPGEAPICRADPSRAARVLGWRAKKTMPEVVAAMLKG